MMVDTPHATTTQLASDSDRHLDGERMEEECKQEEACRADQGAGILIVEDDFLIAMQAENALADAGFNVVGVATSADEAIALARERRPRIALMDIRLAGRRDGIDVASELFRAFGVRCVFATAHDDLQTRTRAAPFSPLGWLTKPYTMASLISLVRDALARRN